jgi:RNA polymerase sigma-70 factor (ECF subfamily)
VPPLFFLALGWFIGEITMSSPIATFEDSALIKLAVAGQNECFVVLMNRYLPSVKKRIASIVRNTTDVEDILQEVSLKVWRHLSTFRSQSNFRTWITRVAINEAFQSYRRQQRRPICQEFADFDNFASPNESVLQSLTRTETTRILREAVFELPDRYKQVVILREFEQLSAQEAAEKLKSSVPAVKTRLFRARLMLLAALQRRRYPLIDKRAPPNRRLVGA